MLHKDQKIYTLAAALVVIFVFGATKAYAQAQPTSLPNPYRAIENWAKLPEARHWGVVSGVALDSEGNLWAFERCGEDTCAGHDEAPILEFDPTGKLVRSFGAGMFVFPHGIFVDRDNNLWVADARGKDGKGHQVVKFSPDGKVLLTLGTAGVTGEGPNTFNRPSGVVVDRNGDIFVADGHGGDSNSRIVKFSKDGKFIKAWGKKGSAPGEFGALHAIAIDSQGRIFVADRGNKRIQVFDANGNFLEQWTGFGSASGIFVDDQERIYVADSTTDSTGGIRIGSANDGSVSMFIPGVTEGVVADPKGNVYAALTKGITKFVRH